MIGDGDPRERDDALDVIRDAPRPELTMPYVESDARRTIIAEARAAFYRPPHGGRPTPRADA